MHTYVCVSFERGFESLYDVLSSRHEKTRTKTFALRVSDTRQVIET